jgi:hypothetical protein
VFVKVSAKLDSDRWGVTVMRRSMLAAAVVCALLGGVEAAHADGRYYGGHGGHGGGRTQVFLGLGLYGGPLWYRYPYPAYYYAPPTVLSVSPPSTVYIQPDQETEEHFWYYCTSPQGYYPYVKKCPNGWLRVAPEPTDR